MSASSKDQESEHPALWQFVPLASYARPESPATHVAVTAWARMKQLFQRNPAQDDAPAKREEELRRLPQLQLQHVARPIEWEALAPVLEESMATQWGDDLPGVRFVIGQPHCGHAEIASQWASEQQATLIEPPSMAQILGNDQSWHRNWASAGDKVWVLPRLERCFLRHANGLDLVRQLLEAVASGRAARGLIACDSWAWAYLQRVWPLPRPAALTLQAFNGQALARLFSLLAAPGGKRRLSFRHASSGQETLGVPYEGSSCSDDLIRLAAHCRGNPGTARDYWRQRMRSEPEADVEADNDQSDASTNADANEVIWVSATLPEPALPIEADEDVALVLHALLLHGGLPEAALAEVLPLSRQRSLATLRRLQQLEVCEISNEYWRVSALAYALVRAWLRGRDFLTDDF